MRLLANPVILRAAIVLFCAAFAFLLGLLLVRKLRNNITAERELTGGPIPSLDTLPLHVYNTVIQQLKQQKHELLVQSQADHHRAKTNENFSQTVLSNLSCGVLVFGHNGLVKTANPAAKAILGFASTTGMSAEDIFRHAEVRNDRLSAATSPERTPDDAVRVVDEIHSVLREGSKRRRFETDYQGPAGGNKFLSITVSQVPAVDGGLLGVTCLINDLSELEGIRREQQLHGEISAEMALQLRTSLTTIAGFAQQLANNRDPEMAQELARDIAQEAAQLDRSIGGFLTTQRVVAGTAAR